MEGTIRWTIAEVRRRLRTFLIGTVAVSLAFIAFSASQTLPTVPAPTFGTRVANGLIALGFAIAVVLVLTSAYALVVAPYQQRNALRGQVRGWRTRAASLPIPREDQEAIDHRERIVQMVASLDTPDGRYIRGLSGDEYQELREHLLESNAWVKRLVAAVTAFERLERFQTAIRRSIARKVAAAEPGLTQQERWNWTFAIMNSVINATPASLNRFQDFAEVERTRKWGASLSRRTDAAYTQSKAVLASRPLRDALREDLRATSCSGCRRANPVAGARLD
jgi:hypothetical protein